MFSNVLAQDDAVRTKTRPAEKRTISSGALAGVPPASRLPADEPPFSASLQGADVFGETPKTAVETTALPKTIASFQLSG
jgi:hypothetical protein